MKNLLRIGAVFGVMLAAVPAQATNFVFNTVNEGAVAGSGAGNSFTYRTGTGQNAVNMKVSAWSLGLDGQLKQGTLASWGTNGLGIYQQNERTDDAYHQIDNVSGWEFAVLQFDRAVTLTSGIFNAFQLGDRDYVDNDAFVSAATLAGPWNQSLTASGLGGLTSQFNANGFNTDSTAYKTSLQTFSPAQKAAGNIWLIGGSVNGPDGQNDAFKLAQVSGATVSPVPEPAAWAMMIVGVGAVGFSLRRAKRRSDATFDAQIKRISTGIAA